MFNSVGVSADAFFQSRSSQNQLSPIIIRFILSPNVLFQLTHEMAQAAGIDSEFDAELYHALRNNREKNEGEGILWEYLLVSSYQRLT